MHETVLVTHAAFDVHQDFLPHLRPGLEQVWNELGILNLKEPIEGEARLRDVVGG